MLNYVNPKKKIAEWKRKKEEEEIESSKSFDGSSEFDRKIDIEPLNNLQVFFLIINFNLFYLGRQLKSE